MGNTFYSGYAESGGLNKFFDTGSGLTGLGAAKAKRQKAALELQQLERETHQNRFSEAANFENQVEEATFKMFDIPEGEKPTMQQYQAGAATVPNAMAFITDYVRNVPQSSQKDKEYQAIVKNSKEMMRKQANGDLPEEVNMAAIGMKAFYDVKQYDSRKAGYATGQRVSETMTLMAQGQNRQQGQAAAEQAAAEQAASAEASAEASAAAEEVPETDTKKPVTPMRGPKETPRFSSGSGGQIFADREAIDAAQEKAAKEAGAEWDAANPNERGMQARDYSGRQKFIEAAEEKAKNEIRNPQLVEEAPTEETPAPPVTTPTTYSAEEASQIPPPKTPAQGTAQVGKAIKEDKPITTTQAQAVTKDYASGKKPKQFWDRPAGRAILQRSLQTQGVIKGKDLTPDELARNVGYVATGEMYDSKFLGAQATALSAANKQRQLDVEANEGLRDQEKEAVDTNLSSILARPKFDEILGEGAAESLKGQAEMNMKSEYQYLRESVLRARDPEDGTPLVNRASKDDRLAFDAMRTTVSRYMSSLALAYTAWNQESREEGGSGADRSMKTFLANASEGEHEIFWGWFGSDNELATEVRQSMGLSLGEIEALDVSLNGTAKGNY